MLIFLDLIFLKWCVKVVNDIKHQFCSISTKQDKFSRFDSFLSKWPISWTILAICFKRENVYIWKQNMHFLIKASNTENLNPPGPLLWDRVARIVHDIGHFDKNESNLEKLSCFVDIEQNLFFTNFALTARIYIIEQMTHLDSS